MSLARGIKSGLKRKKKMPKGKKKKSQYRVKQDRKNRVRNKIRNFTKLLKKYPNSPDRAIWEKKLGEFEAIQNS